MMAMKKFSLLLIFILSVFVANAWSRKIDEAVVIVAKENLTPEAKSVVVKYLGDSYADDVQYLYALEKERAKQLSKRARAAAAELHYLHLDSNFQPKSVEGNDALKAIEEALVTLRNRNTHSAEEVTTALRTIINLMCDIHTISKIRIDGIEHSQHDFKYSVPASEIGKKKDDLKATKWSRSWNGFDGGYGFFSANYWAEDIQIYLGNRYAEYAQGSLGEWVSENGKLAARYLELCKPDGVVSYTDRRLMSPVNYDMMIKATCRLAALLNDVLK
jgi:hypothetical protein